MPPLVIFGIDWSALSASINWGLGLYIMIALAAVGFGVTKLSTTPISTVLFAIGAIAVFMLFGFRWFSNVPTGSNAWPPSINMCPDYLSMFTSGTGTSAVKRCVDMLGVSSNGVLIKQLAIPTTDLDNATKVFKYTSADVTSALALADPAKTARIQDICTACSTAGVTWEGVYDSDTCLLLTTQNSALAPSSICT
jgi:hypothetical protein